jgi:IS30 family transposase
MAYKQLTYAQRCQIFALHRRGFSCRSIAIDVGVHHTTISRELLRNRGGRGYFHDQAHRMSLARRHRLSPRIVGNLRQLIHRKLALKWSPDQIAGWLRRHEICQISGQAIYRHIGRHTRLRRHLRHGGKGYRRSVQGRSGPISGRVCIQHRPESVALKARVGDWELDTIRGAGRSVVVSMVDRASKLCQLRLAVSPDATRVSRALLAALMLPNLRVRTLTADNGAEFAKHVGLGRKLRAGFYFARPYHAWERGLNEHTNGLVRQFLPKGMNFDTITPARLRHIQYLLNNRPRAVLGFLSPKEAYERLAKNDQAGALEA